MQYMKRGATLLNKLRLGLAYASGPVVLLGLAGVFIYFLLWFKLGTLLPGLSPTEATAQAHLANGDVTLQSILDNPLYLPYSIILYVLQSLNLHGITAIRGVSAVIGTATVVCFYLLIRRWHTPRMAVFGTLLFGASSWYLHAARFGSTDILYAGIVMIIISGVWLQTSKRRRLALAILLGISALYLYVPGMIWFIIIGLFWQRKRIVAEMSRVPNWFNGLVVATGLVLVVPLVWSINHDPTIVRALLGLPEQLPSPGQLLENTINLPLHIFVRGPNDPERWLPGTPYLDIFSSMMLFIGIYWSIFRFRLDRIRVLFGVLLLGSILVIIGGPVRSTLLIPFIYLLISAGMTFMLQQWFAVFPRNPIPRTIGTLLLSISVLVTVFYHVNHYFIAWPNTPEVRATYSYKPIIHD
jgi:hypothetical protein